MDFDRFGRSTGSGWFLTFTGIRFYPLDPRAEDVSIVDISHSLSNICRFGGHSRVFYSVAQHSVMVSHLVPDEMALIGLMHDATEAYVGDMVRPLKVQMPSYQEAEGAIWEVIKEKFGLSLSDDQEVQLKHADNVALIAERECLITRDAERLSWGSTLESIADSGEAERLVIPLTPREARTLFDIRYNELTWGRDPSILEDV